MSRACPTDEEIVARVEAVKDSLDRGCSPTIENIHWLINYIEHAVSKMDDGK